MPVHLYGHIAAMDRFAEIGKKHGVQIIEDARARSFSIVEW
jgi:dTDP-4-amino-4,6-dideoxygalactose transaminase